MSPRAHLALAVAALLTCSAAMAGAVQLKGTLDELTFVIMHNAERSAAEQTALLLQKHLSSDGPLANTSPPAQLRIDLAHSRSLNTIAKTSERVAAAGMRALRVDLHALPLFLAFFAGVASTLVGALFTTLLFMVTRSQRHMLPR